MPKRGGRAGLGQNGPAGVPGRLNEACPSARIISRYKFERRPSENNGPVRAGELAGWNREL